MLKMKKSRDVTLARVPEAGWTADADRGEIHAIPGWPVFCDLYERSWLLYENYNRIICCDEAVKLHSWAGHTSARVVTQCRSLHVGGHFSRMPHIAQRALRAVRVFDQAPQGWLEVLWRLTANTRLSQDPWFSTSIGRNASPPPSARTRPFVESGTAKQTRTPLRFRDAVSWAGG